MIVNSPTYLPIYLPHKIGKFLKLKKNLLSFMTYSQIWLNPFVDDRQSTYLVPNSQNLKCFEKKNPLVLNKRKEKERKKRTKERKKNTTPLLFFFFFFFVFVVFFCPHFCTLLPCFSSSSVPTSVLCSSVSFFVPGRLPLPLPPVSLSLSYTQGSQDQDPEVSQKEWGERERERERELRLCLSLVFI